VWHLRIPGRWTTDLRDGSPSDSIRLPTGVCLAFCPNSKTLSAIGYLAHVASLHVRGVEKCARQRSRGRIGGATSLDSNHDSMPKNSAYGGQKITKYVCWTHYRVVSSTYSLSRCRSSLHVHSHSALMTKKWRKRRYWTLWELNPRPFTSTHVWWCEATEENC
jgi:hypothetical protein